MEKKNVYQMVTDKIISQLEKGRIPWQKPWKATGSDGHCINYMSRKPYSLLNQFLLEWREGEYLTFNQIKQLGGSIKKGAKSGMVVFFTMAKSSEKKVKDEDGEEKTVNHIQEYQFPVLRYYNVFHINDCVGIESKFQPVEETEDVNVPLPVEVADNVVNGYVGRETHLKFQNDKPSNRAYYAPSLDQVVVPMLSQYEVVELYYSTTFHELTHSTMHPDRCNRRAESGKVAAFGNEDYSREELVAELGASMLCQLTGLDCEKAFNNSVAYIQSWLKALRNDNHMIVWAASRAEKAAKYIMGES